MTTKRRRIVPPDWSLERPILRTRTYNKADGVAEPARVKVAQRRYVDKKRPEPVVRRYIDATVPTAVCDAAGYCHGDVLEVRVIKPGYVLLRRIWPPLEGEIREGVKRSASG